MLFFSLPEEVLHYILVLSKPLTIRRCQQVSLGALSRENLAVTHVGLPLST